MGTTNLNQQSTVFSMSIAKSTLKINAIVKYIVARQLVFYGGNFFEV